MARKRRDDDAEDEREFRTKFIARLRTATTLAEAAAVLEGPIMQVGDVPYVGAIGRAARGSLDHFLRGFERTGAEPPFRVNRAFPIVPCGANAAERSAYRQLVQRLAANCQITTADADYVAERIAAVQPKLSDFP